MPEFSTGSAAKLATCHPSLQAVFNEVIKTQDCMIIEGHRDQVQQEHDFEIGTSKLQWPESRHNSIPSEAVDAMPRPVNWQDADGIAAFAALVLATAERLGIKLVWGGHWVTFPDRDHFELAQ